MFPASYTVRTKEEERHASDDAAEFDKIQQASASKALKLIRKEIVWTSRLTEITSKDALLKAIPHISPAVYSDIVDERQLSNLCGYPTCSRKPRRQFDASATPSLKLSLNKVYDVKSSGQYCSQTCQKRSEWYKQQCLGPLKRTELLEDLTPSQAADIASRDAVLATQVLPTGGPSTSTTRTASYNADNLVIKENDTAHDQPKPPSREQRDFDAPSLADQRPKAASILPFTNPKTTAVSSRGGASPRFILGKEMKTRRPAPATPMLQEERNDITSQLDALSISLTSKNSVHTDASTQAAQATDAEDEEEEEEVDDEDDEIRAMLDAGLALRKQLRAVGELE